MSELVRINQSTFIQGHRIHENFRTVQLTCRWLHARRCPAVLLKVDLAKVFDTVGWPFLLEVLEHAGFPTRWRDWISAILSSASAKVLVNGRPRNQICHARGLRQGDPLSPLLFVIVMEVLNALIAEADRRSVFAALLGDAIKYRASVYAENLLIFLSPVVEDFNCIRQMLELFTGALGLATNVDKGLITPIRCTSDQVAAIQQVFPCRVQEFPTRYLGAPLSLSRLSRSEERRLVDALASRTATWKAGLLTNAG